MFHRALFLLRAANRRNRFISVMAGHWQEDKIIARVAALSAAVMYGGATCWRLFGGQVRGQIKDTTV